MFLTTDGLPGKFEEKLRSAKRVDIASAWATFGPGLDALCRDSEKRGVKIRAMIGTFGNAPDPDALERLNKIGKLCLVEGRGTLFHPKVYIFRNGNESSVWIGSANFTRAGFGRNEEVVYQTGSCREAAKWFERRWEKHGGPSPASEIEKYRKRRKRQGVSKAAAEMAGQQEQGRMSRPVLLKEARDWAKYREALERCDELWRAEGREWTVLEKKLSYVHTIEKGWRIAHLGNWAELDDRERPILLGLRDGVDGVWGLLGTLRAAGEVKAVFGRSGETGNRRILRRVRKAVGLVIEAPDEEFPGVAVKALEQICRENRFGTGTATRLLTLARPDRLVSVNKGSRMGLATVFGLKRTALGEPENYGRLLERIYKTPWYCGQRGRSKRDRQLWDMRAELIDSFVYDPSSEG